MDRSEYQNPEEINQLAMGDGYDPEIHGPLEPHNEYIMKFNIIFNKFDLYSKASNLFYEIVCSHIIPINYENDDNCKQIKFSSDFIQEYKHDKLGNKPINSVLHYGDIQNIFFSKELFIKFNDYIKHTIITLRNILYKK
jgi:hypothetical protein